MRVALLMTGGCRQLWLTAPSIYKNVINENNADVFLYLNTGSMEPDTKEEEQDIVNTVFPTNVKGIKFTDDAYNKERDELISSNHIKIDGFYKQQGRDVWDKQLNHHNTDQYLKVKKCCEMAVDYATENNFKYDIIARVRPDIGWLNRFDLQRPAASDTLYVNYSQHEVAGKLYDWVEDTCVFGSQDSALKFWSAFSDSMVAVLELCDQSYDLTCATEKLLAKVLINTGIKYVPINDYYGYSGDGWIRPKLAKYFVNWSKSENFSLVEKYGTSGLAVYFDRISQENIVMDPTLIV